MRAWLAPPPSPIFKPAALAFNAGCGASRPVTCSEQTAEPNRVYHVNGRADRPIIYRASETLDAPLTLLTLLFIHGLGSSKAT